MIYAFVEAISLHYFNSDSEIFTKHIYRFFTKLHGVWCLLQVKKPPRKPIEEEFDDDLYNDLYSDLSVSTAGDNITEYEVSLRNNTSLLYFSFTCRNLYLRFVKSTYLYFYSVSFTS